MQVLVLDEQVVDALPDAAASMLFAFNEGMGAKYTSPLPIFKVANNPKVWAMSTSFDMWHDYIGSYLADLLVSKGFTLNSFQLFPNASLSAVLGSAYPVALPKEIVQASIQSTSMMFSLIL